MKKDKAMFFKKGGSCPACLSQITKKIIWNPKWMPDCDKKIIRKKMIKKILGVLLVGTPVWCVLPIICYQIGVKNCLFAAAVLLVFLIILILMYIGMSLLND